MNLLNGLILLALGLLLSVTAEVGSAQVFTAAGQIPQFLNPVTYTVPGATMAVLADVNGDGILDIVTANGCAPNALNPGGQGISVLLGNGDGTFQAALTAMASGNPNFVVVGDFNNDGKADIAVANGSGTNTVSLLYGNGDGTFQLPIDTVISGTTPVIGFSGRSGSLVAADFNGDGKLDLAVAFTTAIGSSAEVLLNSGDGTFSIGYTAGGAAVLAGDFDRDGKQDLFLYGGGSTIKIGNGDGTFRDGLFNFLSPFQNIDATVGDFNGDGTLDIISVNSLNLRTPLFEGNKISYGLPGGTFSTASTNFRINTSNATLQVFNATPGGSSNVDSGLICTTLCARLVTLRNVGGGKFIGQFSAVGPFTFVGAQSSQGGSVIAPVTQK